MVYLMLRAEVARIARCSTDVPNCPDGFQFPQVHQLAQGQLQVLSCVSAVLSGVAVLSSLVPSEASTVVADILGERPQWKRRMVNCGKLLCSDELVVVICTVLRCSMSELTQKHLEGSTCLGTASPW